MHESMIHEVLSDKHNTGYNIVTYKPKNLKQ